MIKPRLWPRLVASVFVIILYSYANSFSVLANFPVADDLWSYLLPPKRILAQETLNLSNRHRNSFVNEVFGDNILLTLFYLRNGGTSQPVSRDEFRKSFHYEFTLSPGDLFAFHEDLMNSFSTARPRTTNAHFGANEGFRSDGYLTGDGVCHLASFLNMTAKSASLMVLAPTNHDFAEIPDIPKVYGTSVYFHPSTRTSNTLQNLYIVNNRQKPVVFVFNYHDNLLELKILETENVLIGSGGSIPDKRVIK